MRAETTTGRPVVDTVKGKDRVVTCPLVGNGRQIPVSHTVAVSDDGVADQTDTLSGVRTRPSTIVGSHIFSVQFPLHVTPTPPRLPSTPHRSFTSMTSDPPQNPESEPSEPSEPLQPTRGMKMGE
jgi:hypothetical protein